MFYCCKQNLKAGLQIKFVIGPIGKFLIIGTFSALTPLNCFSQQFLYFLLNRLSDLAARILVIQLNRTCKIMLCDCYLATLTFFMDQFYSNHEILTKIVTLLDRYIIQRGFVNFRKLLLNKCQNLLLHNIAIVKIFDCGKFGTGIFVWLLLETQYK